jgi:hypothetical protein
MRLLKVLVVLCALLLFAAPANALSITPSTIPQNTGDQNDMPDIWAAIKPIITPLDPMSPLYKSSVGGAEEGSLAGSYQTTYSNTLSDPSDALIKYTGGCSIGGTDVWLLVKDGNQKPAWYLFDLDLLGWNGLEDLRLSGFWPRKGAISNVSLYGTWQQVQEPATLLLLGFGIIGLAAVGRKKFFRAPNGGLRG